MKQFFIVFWLSLTLSMNTSAQTFESPVAYFDYFNQQHTAIVQQNLNYLQVVVHSEDVEQIVAKRLSLLQLIDQIKNELDQIPDYDIDAGLKSTMRDVLSTYKTLYQGAYLEIEALKPKAQQSFELMQTYIDNQSAAEKKIAEASRRFLNAQRAFATANEIVLVEGERSSETEQLNALNDYQRYLFLSSFRINKLNAIFLNMMDTADEIQMNTAINNLLNGCKEEQIKLEKAATYHDNFADRNTVHRQLKILQSYVHDEETI